MRSIYTVSVIIGLCALSSMGMSRHGQYDEEAREFERMEKEYKKAGYTEPSETNSVADMATGVKQATYDSTRDLLQDTAEGTTENAPVVGTVQGVVKGSGKVLENTSKGIAEIVTFGRADSSSFRVEEPEHGSDDTTKVKFNF